MSETMTQVRTNLYIGGEERTTAEELPVPDPGKAGRIVGVAASASPQDVSDAVAAAKAAYPAWSALTPQQRAEQMNAALAGIEEHRDDDAAILSQENGKIRMEAWVDSLVFEIRWKLATALADEIDQAKVLSPAPGIPVETTITYKSLGVEGGGFTITALPAISACGRAAPRIAIGQLNGTMIDTTPSDL